MRAIRLALPLLLATLAGTARADLSEIDLPEGFVITKFADVPGARSLTMSATGTVFVGTRGDKVYAVRDDDGDLVAETVKTIDTGLEQPNGVALKGGNLYVAEISRVLRYDGIETRLGNPPEPRVVTSAFPSDTHHGWKFIAFGPDGKLYVPVGAPCNVCAREDGYASIFRINADGTGKETVAVGVRNTVGFAWHPVTGDLWFTDNGRDMLGNDVPPDELNHVTRLGQDFGFPACHGMGIRDPDYGTASGCATSTKPALAFDAHVAALGIRFYTGDMFPASYKHAAFVAEHGSWNRTPPNGYRVTLVTFAADGTPARRVFASGWLRANGRSWGRPVDVLVYTDGSLLVSDDQAGAIYRIAYRR